MIGAGRLGKNIARAIIEEQLGQLTAVCNRSHESGLFAVQQIGSGIAVSATKELPPAELTFITTPDDAISTIVNELAQGETLTPGSVIIHCSGALSTKELTPLKEQGCFIGNFHPAKAFRHDSLNPNVFRNCLCIVEGDKQAIDLLIAIFKPLGTTLIPINAEKKASYHAAGVFSANYLVTLSAATVELLIEAGIPQDLAHQLNLQLMQSSLTNIEQTAVLSQALTGPLARGDMHTIEKHLAALHQPALNALYRAAAIATLSLTNLDVDKKSVLQNLLTPG